MNTPHPRKVSKATQYRLAMRRCARMLRSPITSRMAYEGTDSLVIAHKSDGTKVAPLVGGLVVSRHNGAVQVATMDATNMNDTNHL